MQKENKKIVIKESELKKIISEEVTRFKKIMMLENEKKQLTKQLQEMYMGEEIMEENWLTDLLKKAGWYVDIVEREMQRPFIANALKKAIQQYGGGNEEKEKQITASLAKLIKTGGGAGQPLVLNKEPLFNPQTMSWTSTGNVAGPIQGRDPQSGVKEEGIQE